jgi:hypothetical protein
MYDPASHVATRKISLLGLVVCGGLCFVSHGVILLACGIGVGMALAGLLLARQFARCPHCHEVVTQDFAPRCPHCDEELHGYAVPGPEGEPSPEPTTPILVDEPPLVKTAIRHLATLRGTRQQLDRCVIQVSPPAAPAPERPTRSTAKSA